MPMGPAPLGFAYFVGVKFAGYTVAGLAIRKVYPEFTGSIVKVGATRTTIGIGAGLMYGVLWWLGSELFPKANPSGVFYFLGLLPIRVGEWMWLMYLFFDRSWIDPQKAFRVAVGGSIWSYCLDAIGIGAAFVIPGGIWVC
jgi:hypothetical protein